VNLIVMSIAHVATVFQPDLKHLQLPVTPCYLLLTTGIMGDSERIAGFSSEGLQFLCRMRESWALTQYHDETRV